MATDQHHELHGSLLAAAWSFRAFGPQSEVLLDPQATCSLRGNTVRPAKSYILAELMK